MNPLIDMQDDDRLTEALRATDLPVKVDAEAWSKQLAIRRRGQRRRRTAMISALPLLMVAIGWSVLTLTATHDAPTGSSPLASQFNPDDEPDPPEVEPIGDSQYQRMAVRMEERALLAAKKAELLRLQQETESLRKIKSRQQWALSRELVSRAGLKPALTMMPY